jgi:hypothetical protein
MAWVSFRALWRGALGGRGGLLAGDGVDGVGGRPAPLPIIVCILSTTSRADGGGDEEDPEHGDGDELRGARKLLSFFIQMARPMQTMKNRVLMVMVMVGSRWG